MDDLRSANDRFYAALNAAFAGDAAPMAEVWSGGDDITLMGRLVDASRGVTPSSVSSGHLWTWG